jgi:hypothetical protein
LECILQWSEPSLELLAVEVLDEGRVADAIGASIVDGRLHDHQFTKRALLRSPEAKSWWEPISRKQLFNARKQSEKLLPSFNASERQRVGIAPQELDPTEVLADEPNRARHRMEALFVRSAPDVHV